MLILGVSCTEAGAHWSWWVFPTQHILRFCDSGISGRWAWLCLVSAVVCKVSVPSPGKSNVQHSPNSAGKIPAELERATGQQKHSQLLEPWSCFLKALLSLDCNSLNCCSVVLTGYLLQCSLFSLQRFINARRRILQPMLDASNPDPAPKAKKIKSQHRPTQRFWPNSIAAGVLQQQGGNSGTNPDGKDRPSVPWLFRDKSWW